MLGAMRNRRRWLVLTGLAAVAGLAGYAGWLWLAIPPHQINVATFRRIQHGMTVEEVEGILGVPSGDYRDRTAGWPVGAVFLRSDEDQLVKQEWHSDEASIGAYFNKQGRYVGGGCINFEPPTFFQRVRARLGW
jgi:hypothetical protein